jgi:predicted nucleotidyltransferase component of viral defense system
MKPRDAAHEQLMKSILKGIDDTPLVLKGGTALLLAYGLDRFSEDLDFDAPHKLNLNYQICAQVLQP